ncbi:hypothetical protein M3226_05585 [Neobacillus cucumis]|uniref:hypothetical protein n=1 Tax=Neobacillus cucumis TaxID=1740721 RepID=UPI00203D7D4A|nr:hypothetical protein [Neobacillus cucumis]MCM3725171.1 hypothetical protein [Neobacillus cucumis]
MTTATDTLIKNVGVQGKREKEEIPYTHIEQLQNVSIKIKVTILKYMKKSLQVLRILKKGSIK